MATRDVCASARVCTALHFPEPFLSRAGHACSWLRLGCALSAPECVCAPCLRLSVCAPCPRLACRIRHGPRVDTWRPYVARQGCSCSSLSSSRTRPASPPPPSKPPTWRRRLWPPAPAQAPLTLGWGGREGAVIAVDLRTSYSCGCRRRDCRYADTPPCCRRRVPALPRRRVTALTSRRCRVRD